MFHVYQAGTGRSIGVRVLGRFTNGFRAFHTAARVAKIATRRCGFTTNVRRDDGLPLATYFPAGTVDLRKLRAPDEEEEYQGPEREPASDQVIDDEDEPLPADEDEEEEGEP